MRLLHVAGLVCLLVIGGCGDERPAVVADDPSTPAAPPSVTVTTESAAPEAPDPPEATPTPRARCVSPAVEPHHGAPLVFVYVSCKHEQPLPDNIHAFVRPVPAEAGVEERLRIAVTAYFEGPTPAEGNQFHAFGPEGTLNSVSVQGDRAVIDVDLDDDLASTSAQSMTVWSHLRALAFQFPGIELMEPRYDGSCAAFGQVVQAGECLVARRSVGSARG